MATSYNIGGAVGSPVVSGAAQRAPVMEDIVYLELLLLLYFFFFFFLQILPFSYPLLLCFFSFRVFLPFLAFYFLSRCVGCAIIIVMDDLFSLKARRRTIPNWFVLLLVLFSYFFSHFGQIYILIYFVYIFFLTISPIFPLSLSLSRYVKCLVIDIFSGLDAFPVVRMYLYRAIHIPNSSALYIFSRLSQLTRDFRLHILLISFSLLLLLLP